MKIDESKEIQIFQKFIEGRKILIADSNAAARSSLFNVMRELGVKTHQLFLANNYNSAQQQILDNKPNIVIAEYDLGKHCGLELLQSQREQRPDETKNCLFIIVTGNTSQTAAARALEEDIDAYIIKPYTLDYVRKTILTTALMKIKPPAYIVKIEEGKKAMASSQLDEAEKLFNEATALDVKPSLAYYYLGQLKFIREVLSQAQSNYQKGLKFNTIHYKCMIGMYDLLMHEKRHEEAYDVVKRIARYFPANPKRLAEVLRLAIMTGKYEDIERYYLIFTNMDSRNDMLVRYTCASLIVCGKYYLASKQGSGRALDLFRKAAATSGNSPRILNEIIPIMLEYELVEEAAKFLEKFPAEQQASNEYFWAQVMVWNAQERGSAVLEKGRVLLDNKFYDFRLYEILIRQAVKAKSKTMAENFFWDAVGRFPDKKEALETILKALPKS